MRHFMKRKSPHSAFLLLLLSLAVLTSAFADVFSYEKQHKHVFAADEQSEHESEEPRAEFYELAAKVLPVSTSFQLKAPQAEVAKVVLSFFCAEEEKPTQAAILVPALLPLFAVVFRHYTAPNAP